MDFFLEEGVGEIVLGAILAIFVLGIIVAFFLDGKLAELFEIYTDWICG